MKRSFLSVSLRALILLITLTAIGLGVGRVVYYERYARHKQAEQYFEAMGVRAIVGDPCPPDFVYWIDGTGRGFGLPHTDTPDLIDRLAGRRLSHSPVRELTFRGSFQEERRFTREIASNLLQLTPFLESISFPNGGKNADGVDKDVVDITISQATKLKELRHVSFLNWPVGDEHIESLVALPHLQVLHVQSPHLTETSLASIRKMKELRFVALVCPNITAENAQSFHRDRPEVFARINSVDYGSRKGIYFYNNL